jgi:Family of unknown function (DUF6516)
MTAKLLVRRRVEMGEIAFAEIVVWELPAPLRGSTHSFKYRLAFVSHEVCVLRYDNEAGRGDHRHIGGKELPYVFLSPKQLAADFFDDIQRYQREHPDH